MSEEKERVLGDLTERVGLPREMAPTVTPLTEEEALKVRLADVKREPRAMSDLDFQLEQIFVRAIRSYPTG